MSKTTIISNIALLRLYAECPWPVVCRSWLKRDKLVYFKIAELLREFVELCPMKKVVSAIYSLYEAESFVETDDFAIHPSIFTSFILSLIGHSMNLWLQNQCFHQSF